MAIKPNPKDLLHLYILLLDIFLITQSTPLLYP